MDNIETVALEIDWKELLAEERSLGPLRDFKEILFAMKLSNRKKTFLRVHLAKELLPEIFTTLFEEKGVQGLQNGKKNRNHKKHERLGPLGKDKKKNTAALNGPKRNIANEENTKAS
ncbi:hypothetical protein F8M41_001761 [Gigaspora margarita]|uniref:Uncharacterized protein n=1 Tax=Gigaspora margarita TaxID=4874 RepID=A0A8H3XDZ1_GIGMA|nr:hypothetical protein F8M41_001761 [Gigaspora margarita]